MPRTDIYVPYGTPGTGQSAQHDLEMATRILVGDAKSGDYEQPLTAGERVIVVDRARRIVGARVKAQALLDPQRRAAIMQEGQAEERKILEWAREAAYAATGLIGPIAAGVSGLLGRRAAQTVTGAAVSQTTRIMEREAARLAAIAADRAKAAIALKAFGLPVTDETVFALIQRSLTYGGVDRLGRFISAARQMAKEAGRVALGAAPLYLGVTATSSEATAAEPESGGGYIAPDPYIPMSERRYPTPPPGAAGYDDAGPGTPAPYTRGSYQPLTPGQRAEEDKRSQARADYAKMVAWLKAKKAAEAQGLPIPDFRTFQVPSAAPGQPRETVEERVGKRPAPALDTRQYTPDDFTAGLEAEIRDRAGKTPQQVHEAALEAASARRQSLTLTPVEQQHNIAAAYVRDHDAALAQLKRAREITITMRKYPASTPKKDLDRAVENERAMEAVERKAWFEAQNALGAVRGLPAHPMPAREKETAMAAARRLGAAGKK